MLDAAQVPDEHIAKTLDLMVEANWVYKYAHNTNTGFAIEWTQKGENQITAVFSTVQDLDLQKLDPQLWWALVSIADGTLGPRGRGIVGLDLADS